MTIKKIDQRKNYLTIIDVETTGKEKLVYDLGVVIADRKGNIYEKVSFTIKEVFSDKNEMLTSYYAEKMPLYLERIANNETNYVSFAEAIDHMKHLIRTYKSDTICAYNLSFDKNALVRTAKKLGYEGKVLCPPIKKELCLWGLACQTIFQQKTFQNLAIQEGWVTKKGNIKTSAEIAYRYIKGLHEFEEEHTGLEDAMIETEIMAQCFRQNKKIKRGIISQPWRLVNKKS